MLCRGFALSSTLLWLLWCDPLPAQILVPDDYDTIQEAIDEAEDGDTIEVAADTYVETIDFDGKAITVVSIDPKQPEHYKNRLPGHLGLVHLTVEVHGNPIGSASNSR